jgi:membrane protease subunit HflC
MTKSANSTLLFGAAFVAFVAAQASLFVVDQTQQAMVLRFGKPVNIIKEPGLQVKVPFLDTVEYYDKRLLVFNAPPMTVILQDQDRLNVDAYVTYKITDPLVFYQAVRGEQIMQMRLESILEKSLRDVMGQETLATLLSPKRDQIMANIRDKVSGMAMGAKETLSVEAGGDKAAKSGFGIQVVDVRIMRTDLPKETSDPIYKRMRSDRQKVAEKFRAEGRKESQIITSEAEKQRTILIAEAQNRAESIRGEGDATASKIYADAFGKDAEFSDFYQTLQTYRKTLNKDDTTVILSPDNSFLKHLSE